MAIMGVSARARAWLLLSAVACAAAARRSKDVAVAKLVADQENAKCVQDVPRYTKHCNHGCNTRTVSKHMDSANATDFCRAACEMHPECQCFTIRRGRCRIGVKAASSVREENGYAAYVRNDGGNAKLTEVSNSSELPSFCRNGMMVGKTGDCTSYYLCMSNSWEEATCGAGLSFDHARKHCIWSTQVSGCEDMASETLPEATCGRKRFILASSQAAGVQSWIKYEIDSWFKLAARDSKVQLRAEGQAALHILQTVAIELKNKDMNTSVSRWALFNETEDGKLEMQAVALISQQRNTVNIMAIVSRRSLLRDNKSESGAGKALIRAAIEGVHDEFPTEPAVVIGTPGDAFVEQLYRDHGMEEYGREETGMPKLRLVVPPECVQFVSGTILCMELRLKAIAKIAWRLLPGSANAKETCAHLIPRKQYVKTITRLLHFSA
mmetsp:Transcript_30227/g.85247  ORF Transcript_30227/g.85247 Transcript_30227/m.85247 type:complete len:438 (-) Transcript_30227:17-1330(-)